MYVCMYVCMSVRNGFTTEIYGFMHSLRTFWHVPLRMHCDRAMAWRSRLRTQKIEDDARMRRMEDG